MQLTQFPIVLQSQDTPCDEVLLLIESNVLKVATSSSDNQPTSYLNYINQSLSINVPTGKPPLTLAVDFIAGRSKHRRLYGGGKNQPLPKACGLDKHPDWSILDVTAGLGKDAFVLASLGAQVTLCEQHPALYALLVDAIHRAASDEEAAIITARMACLHNNSLDYLKDPQNFTVAAPDVIYLDPMYPGRKKSAQIKKDMQILQQIIGHENDDESLFDESLKIAKQRVVVKRPKLAQPLGSVPPNYTVKSVNTRYDVYTCLGN